MSPGVQSGILMGFPQTQRWRVLQSSETTLSKLDVHTTFSPEVAPTVTTNRTVTSQTHGNIAYWEYRDVETQDVDTFSQMLFRWCTRMLNSGKLYRWGRYLFSRWCWFVVRVVRTAGLCKLRELLISLLHKHINGFVCLWSVFPVFDAREIPGYLRRAALLDAPSARTSWIGVASTDSAPVIVFTLDPRLFVYRGTAWLRRE